MDSELDQVLIRAYREGDEYAAKQLFERYYDRIKSLVAKRYSWATKSEDLSDIAQAAMKSFFSYARKHSIDFSEAESLWPLLATIAMNKTRNSITHKNRQRRDAKRTTELGEATDPLLAEPGPEEIATISEIVDVLLDSFSDHRRTIVERLLQGHKKTEIAAEFDITERTVYNTQQRAAQILTRVLAEQENSFP